MKKVLFYLFGLLSCFGAVSQNVSIELSIHWQLERDVFNEDSIVNTPMLNITYRNNSDENIYFKKISLPNGIGLPRTGYGFNMNMPPEMRNNWRKRAENSLKFSQFTVGNDYMVEIGSFLSVPSSWFIYNKADTCEECTMDLINDNISDIHEYMTRKPLDTDFPRSRDLYEILGIDKENFVFLQPNETYTETFNIIAFQLVKGNFTFGIKEDTIPDYVQIRFRQTAKLPEKVGEYRLYSGSFHTNAVKVSFKYTGRKTNRTKPQTTIN